MESRIEGSLADLGRMPWVYLGPAEPRWRRVAAKMAQARAVSRVWERDSTLWQRPVAEAAAIEERLGWLDLPNLMLADVGRLIALAAELQAAGYRHAVLLGMGGSSLVAEVLARALEHGPDQLTLAVLDSTDPAQIARVDAENPPAETVYLVASKSGTTVEALTLYAYFMQRCIETVGEADAPRHMIAITDPDTPLQALAEAQGFRAVYINPPDVGGRFSALSLFGLVPGALTGVDLDGLLERARAMARACRSEDPDHNPAVSLGIALGALASDPLGRRDKLMLLTSPRIASLGTWIEQLIAESTGKEGQGIVPVLVTSPLPDDALTPERLGEDRLWVYLRLEGDDNAALDAHLDALAAAEQPVIGIALADPLDLGGEFFRWEFATALAGAAMRVNPFDQPDVEAAKQRARSALAEYEHTRSLPEPGPQVTAPPLTISATDCGGDTVEACLASFFGQAGPGDYVALLAFIGLDEGNSRQLDRIARLLEMRLWRPVTAGVGPRFLHSTGQLHKGGPDTLLALQIVQVDQDDLEVPGESYSFGTLKRAQALGDLQALLEAGRRVLRIDVGADLAGGLDALCERLAAALPIP